MKLPLQIQKKSRENEKRTRAERTYLKLATRMQRIGRLDLASTIEESIRYKNEILENQGAIPFESRPLGTQRKLQYYQEKVRQAVSLLEK